MESSTLENFKKIKGMVKEDLFGRMAESMKAVGYKANKVA
jgi:hypothetical protein